MTVADIIRIKSDIANSLRAHANVAPARTLDLLPIKNLQGKLYEAHVLANICENLFTMEGCRIRLVSGTRLVLKQKGSPINRRYPFFEVFKGNNLFGELFTDLYFSSLSHKLRGNRTPLTKADYHELDIALIQPRLTGTPSYLQVLLAVECKNTSLKKSIIRELLGFRRELSLFIQPQKHTAFDNWPATLVHADPGSVHMLYCPDPLVQQYRDNCLQFGILLQQHRM